MQRALTLIGRVQARQCALRCRAVYVPARAASTAPPLWEHLPQAPLDGNHATAAACEADKSPLTVNLGRGVYKDDQGKSWVLPCVREAEKRIAAAAAGSGDSALAGHEYLKFSGLPAFTAASSSFAFGKDSDVIQEKRVATVQTVSGTGALRVASEFLSRFLPFSPRPSVYVSDPTYVNHYPVFERTGFEVKEYTYYDASTRGLDFEGFARSIQHVAHSRDQEAPKNSVFLLHACAHNPTGVDPSPEQWEALLPLFKEKQHVCFFDCAYQGFASGDPDRDALAFRSFAAAGIPVLVAQSYAKNFGLYGQRIGALNVVADSADHVSKIQSCLNQVIRPMYSNPPLHGARIVSTVFNSPDLAEQWRVDVKTMADRIAGARSDLVSNLKELGSTRDWSHITNQIGMFAFSGLSPEEVEALRPLHVYMNYDGRMSISGINSGNVRYLAECLHSVTS